MSVQGVSRAAFIAIMVLRKRFLEIYFESNVQRLLSPWTAIISRRIFTKSGFISLRKSKKPKIIGLAIDYNFEQY